MKTCPTASTFIPDIESTTQYQHYIMFMLELEPAMVRGHAPLPSLKFDKVKDIVFLYIYCKFSTWNLLKFDDKVKEATSQESRSETPGYTSP